MLKTKQSLIASSVWGRKSRLGTYCVCGSLSNAWTPVTRPYTNTGAHLQPKNTLELRTGITLVLTTSLWLDNWIKDHYAIWRFSSASSDLVPLWLYYLMSVDLRVDVHVPFISCDLQLLHTDISYTWVCGCESSPVLKPSRLQYLPSCGENHFCLGGIINTWLPLNSESLSKRKVVWGWLSPCK